MNKKQKKELIKISTSAVLLAVILLLPIGDDIKRYLYIVPYLIVGYGVLIKAFKGIISLKFLNENFLMALASIVAFFVGDGLESVAVMLFYSVGELFQSVATSKSRKSVKALLELKPEYANVLEGEIERRVSPEEVFEGSIIIVRAGEKIPLDGVIIEGATELDEQSLTGESVPSFAGVGDQVCSGAINLNGVIKIRTTKTFENGTVGQILEMIENASAKKSKTEKFIAKFAFYYTPVVVALAVLLAILPPVFNLVSGNASDFRTWIYRAMIFLVASCPCALVVSIPLCFFATIGGAGSAGILVKNSVTVENLAKVKTVFTDKTGTLTKGEFEVSGVVAKGIEENRLLFYAWNLERFSNHPLAKSLINYCSFEKESAIINDVKEISGQGLIGEINGESVAVGNERLMKSQGVKDFEKGVGSVIYVARNGEYCGRIEFLDAIKSNAKASVEALKKVGIKTVMLTGDNEKAASEVAYKTGIDEYCFGLLPQNKVEKIEFEMKNADYKCAFVGDGVNDAPALATADVGIAMGIKGQDLATLTADVVIADDDMEKIAKAVRISKKCMRITKQNVVFALTVKALALILGAVGLSTAFFAIFADVGVMVLAVLNSVRMLGAKKI